MSDLRDLYQEVILDHNKHPRNFGALEQPTSSAEGYNPICGDHFRVSVELDGDTLRDVRFEGSGCAISTASASLMTDAIKGKTLLEIKTLHSDFQKLVTAEPGAEHDPARLGKLVVMGGVCEYPMRVKCATLAWHTLKAAARAETKTVTTE